MAYCLPMSVPHQARAPQRPSYDLGRVQSERLLLSSQLSSSACNLVCCLAFACPALLTGCDDLSRFRTGEGDVFRGEVIGSDEGGGQDSFIRRGFASHTVLELAFDPFAQAGVPQEDDLLPRTVVAGSVDTYVCSSSVSDCDASSRAPGPFSAAPLVALEVLSHDALSEYSFPGSGRLRNYMFGVHFDSALNGTTVGRDAMLFVSLMDSGKVEVRVVAPSVVSQAGDTEQQWPALFGLFVLSRHQREP